MDGKIIFCQMTQNRLDETRACVERVLPYVDKVVILDGGSIDDTIFYFRNWAMEEPKLEFSVIPWNDKFYEQRTNYLRIADGIAEPGDYILVSDPDEMFDIELLEKLPKIANAMEKHGANVGCFQSRSVTMRGNKRVHENLDDYWKHLFYRWEPGMYYIGNPHETLVIPSKFKVVNFGLVYEHVKQENVTWHRGARNFVVWGVGRNPLHDPDQIKMKVWLGLKELRERNNLPDKWHAFDLYLMRGNVHTELKEWMINHRNVDNFEFASEAREIYKLYFRIYNPEEEPIQLQSEQL